MKVNKLAESLNMKTVDDRQLDEDTLVEGPLDWIKDKLGGASDKLSQQELDQRAKDRADKKQQKATKNTPKILSMDFDSLNSRSKFYKNHDYTKPMSQEQWRHWLEKEVPEKLAKLPPEKQEQEQTKIDAERHNAIVVSSSGLYVRRGAEDLRRNFIMFEPGVNDELTPGFYRQPYKYRKNVGAKKPGSSDVTSADLKKFISLKALTGLQIVDSQGKPVADSVIASITVKNYTNYKVKVGNTQVPLTDWLKIAKAKKLL